MAISLVLVVVAYLAFLGYMFVRGQRAKNVPVVTEESKPDVPPSQDESVALSASDLRKHIDRWAECTRALDYAQSMKDQAHAESMLRELEGLQKNSPRRVDLLFAMAELAHAKRDYAYARNLLMEVLEADPRHSRAREALARGFIETQQYEQALIVGNWLLQRDPYSAVGLDTVALAQIQMGRPEDALSPLRKLIGLDRDNIMALNRLATAYSALGQHDKAVELYRSVLKKDSSNSMTYYNLAACYAQQGQGEEAVNILARASALFGHPFVAAWTQNREFDPVRTNTAFSSFTKTLKAPDGTALMPRPGQREVRMPANGMSMENLQDNEGLVDLK